MADAPSLPYRGLDRGPLEREQFGTKAHVLSLLSESIRVPQGYALSLAEVNEGGHDLSELLERIHGQIADSGRPLIVRSSASFEDTGRAIYPGRFASLRDRTSLADLREGVEYCIEQAASGSRVRGYEAAHGIASEGALTGVLIQQQVIAKYAGVTFTRSPRPYHDFHALIELSEGPASNLLAGKSVGGLFGVHIRPTSQEYTQLAGPAYPLSDIMVMLDSVTQVSLQVEGLLGESQDIEWVWDGSHVYVVQARPARLLLPSRIEANPQIGLPPREIPPLRLMLLASHGQKAAAMQYFKTKHCGAKNAAVISPGANEESVNRELDGRVEARAGTVIRYSFEQQAGLPVIFVPPDEDVTDSYLSNRLVDEWAGIVSDYVYVENSFEAYLGTNSLIVEHIPGNWEPLSNLRPDIFIFEKDATQFWICREPRLSSYEMLTDVRPAATLNRPANAPSADQLAEWADELASHFATFRGDLAASLPVNIHFIRAEGQWHFLNIRPTRDLSVARSHRSPRAEFKAKRYFLVNQPEDLANWDGKAPIVLTIACEDADEGGLPAMARLLDELAVGVVHTTFGALSHPALVLREFGLEVHPMYEQYDVITRHI